ncbi:carbon-nitrogen hydrolase family protein [Sporomusa sp.]|uniref:carbon-nitrogen hydrolase family protein n=1 Tax=Sporomusa sp. TaxID=2078658 RepID=UPI002CA6D514|nr:carbon-nitrogen hydrolase family protein [Sporomusa sp.]HWR09212.1 carbon-nitrogen hydrolase family protein [Sporomusa sp.]
MRVALLHVDVSGGPELRNLDILTQAIRLAADRGAEWIITPETAVQGYFFAVEREHKPVVIPVQPASSIEPIRQLASEYHITVFLCCAEQDEHNGKYYNSCLVIGPDGDILGRHRKKHAHSGVSEGWANRGEHLEPIVCGDIRAGILICADSWYEENAITMADKGAAVIVVPAAWPPGGCGGPPENAWKKASAISGRSLWVCNQTGKQERLDFTNAQSTVITGGEMQLAYCSAQPAALLFDWDFAQDCATSNEFTVLPL